MKVVISYPPLRGKGSPMLTQNRQFQWYHVGSYIYPVVSACAATMLKEKGHQVIWNDGIAERWEFSQFENFIKFEKPDIVIMESKTPVIRQHWEITAKIKELSPETRVVLSGDHVTAFPEESLRESSCDYVITGGDYDFGIVSIAENLSSSKPLEPGIYYRENGSIKNSGAFDLAHDLDEIPYIDRDLTRAYLYGEKWKKRLPFFYTMAGRDCHWGKCTFCAWTGLYPKFRMRTPGNLLDEIERLIKIHKVREIFDDTGTFPVGEWLDEFCEGMIKRGFHKKILFSCNMRFDYLKPEVAKMMKRAGFRKVKSGLESANQKTLDMINKGTTVGDIVDGCKNATKAGLEVQLTIMVGYPWENEKEVMNTLELAKNLMADGHAEMLQATVVVPYPGTKLFKMALENNWFRVDPNEYERYDMTEPLLKTPGLTPEEIVKRCGDIYRTFLTPRYVFRHVSKIRSFEDLSYVLRGSKAVIGHIQDFLKIRR